MPTLPKRFLVLVAMVVAGPAFGRAGVLVEIERLRPGDLEVAGFTLSVPQTVSIEGRAARLEAMRSGAAPTSAWILDARTREVVWDLRDARVRGDGDRVREYESQVELPAGRYEVYASSYPSARRGVRGIGDVLGPLLGKDRGYRDYRRAAKKFRLVITGKGKPLDASDLRAFHEKLHQGALVSMTGLGRDEFRRAVLTLERPMDLQIYAVGEMRRDGNYDYSWIVDRDTRETVWKFDYRHSDPAGGARKNRMIKDVVSLPAGSYVVFTATDGSHSVDDWNSAPPYDPFFWGVTIQAADPKQARFATVSAYEEAEEKNVLVQLTKLRDDDFMSRGFTLKKPMTLRIYALGEGRGPDMADYSWIVDADTREPVWQFEYRKSDHAGGASKNRVIETTIELEKGNYVAYAITDGSHAYRHWNAPRPHDPDHWGLTIYAVDGDPGDVVEYKERDDPSILARIVRVGNDDAEHKRFSLRTRSRVRIYAIGEGQGGRMHDYAWIENADTGREVWQMTYRATEHAGGAKKNRLFNDVITLDAGTYLVYYESDGSHAFGRWNAGPPSDPLSWGVTVRLVEEGK